MAENKKDDKKDFHYGSGWSENLRHRPDPNRVSSLHTPSPGRFDPQPRSAAPIPPDPATLHAGRTPPTSALARRHDPQSIPAEPSYYDIPMLKQPVWKWQIASYFYFGGITAGAYVISRIADRFGGDKFRDMSRLGTYLSLAALAPCPPLLIWDLGDPKRFHHMLRVFKPQTPMNLGTWSILAYSGMSATEALRRYMEDLGHRLHPNRQSALVKVMNNPVVLFLHDAAGVPFALMVAGYTGVLLSCTSNPLWCKNPWLGPLFSASAISNGAGAISLAMDLTTKTDGTESAAHSLLRKVDTAGHAAELACAAGFTRFAGKKAKPLLRGSMKKHYLFSIGGIVAAEILKHAPVRASMKKPVRMFATALGLAAGFSLRWAMVFGGHEAAADPHASRLVSRPKDSAKQIGGSMSKRQR